jgi:hypothetical protein
MPLLGHHAPLMTFFPAIIASAYLGDPGARTDPAERYAAIGDGDAAASAHQSMIVVRKPETALGASLPFNFQLNSAE